jgi:predicted TIM-barrel fold metal-dependent hydrolase
MLIDYHTHFLARAHFGPEFAREWEERGGTGAWPEITAEEYEEAMRGADRTIVFGISAHALGVHTPHEYVAALVRRAPHKFIGFMAIDPTAPHAIAEMEQGAKEFGLRGVKLYPVMARFNPSDPQLRPFFKRASELRLPILAHMGASPASGGLLKYSLPLLVDELAVEFPELRVIMAHLAHPWQREAALVIRKHRNVYADISGLWHRPWQGYEAMIVCLEWQVTHKLLFGSDFPLWRPEDAIGRLRRLNDQVLGTPLPKIPAEIVDQILERDVLEQLGLSV